MLNITNLFVYNSPLEQFMVFNIFNLFTIEGVKFTNLAMNFLFVCFFIFLFFYNYNKKIYGNNNKNIIINSLYTFIKGIFKENVNLSVPYFFSYIYFIFLIIFFSNLLGLVPFSFTITSSIIFTFFFSVSAFIHINITGFKIHGLKFFNIFLPKGAPTAITPFLVIIEFISYNARVFSLAIRLFANMMSGHILLKILASATWALLYFYFPFSLMVTAFPLLVLLIITFLELCIAALQAYVFVTLLCIYFNEAIHLH